MATDESKRKARLWLANPNNSELVQSSLRKTLHESDAGVTTICSFDTDTMVDALASFLESNTKPVEATTAYEIGIL